VLFRLFAGFLGGLLFTVAVFYLVCGVLAPFSNLCGHNAPITAPLVWGASCAAIWIVVFGSRNGKGDWRQR